MGLTTQCVGTVAAFSFASVACGVDSAAPSDAAPDDAVPSMAFIASEPSEGSVDNSASSSCPATVSAYCAEVVNSGETCFAHWADVVRLCGSPDTRGVISSMPCDGYNLASFAGLPDTGGTSFYFSAATGDLGGIVVTPGFVPHPVPCVVPAGFQRPTSRATTKCAAADAGAD